MFIGLESTQTWNISLNHAQHANITPTGTTTVAPANIGPGMCMVTLQHWLLSPWWIWIISCHGLLLQDAHCQNPCISMQCLQDHFSPEGTLCRTWQPRGYSMLTMAPVCQCTLHWVWNRLEVWLNTCSPRNPRSNGQAEAAIKTVKGLLTHAKYSGQDPYLAVLTYHSRPIKAHLHWLVEMLYQQVLTYMPMLNVTTSTNVPPKVQSTMTSEAATRNLYSLPTKPYLSSVMPGTCGPLPPSSTKPIMAHTWSKSLVVDSTDMLMTTFKNVMWMLSESVVSNFGNVVPAASTSSPTTPAVRLPTSVAPTTPTPVAPAATLQTPCQVLPAVCSPWQTQMPLQARLAQPLLSYANQFKAGSHHPGFLKRNRPRLSLQMNLIVPWPGTPQVQLLKCCTLN